MPETVKMDPLNSTIDHFLAQRRTILRAIPVLLHRIAGKNPQTAAQAAKALAAVASDLDAPQLTSVIRALAANVLNGQQDTIANTLTVFSSLAAIPEPLREEFFGALVHCMNAANETNASRAGNMFLERIDEAPPKAVLPYLKAAAQKVETARRAKDICRALRWVCFAQLANAKGPHDLRTDRGIKLILSGLVHKLKDVRALNCGALVRLAPAIGNIMSADVVKMMRKILTRRTGKLKPEIAEMVIEARKFLLHTLGQARAKLEPLAAALLASAAADPHGAMMNHELITGAFRPVWSTAGMPFGSAPDFSRVWPDLRRLLLAGGDFPPIVAARILGNYGPAARGRLREMVRIFKERYGDCGVSAPLLWAILNVGAGTQTPARTLEWLRKQARPCPHALELEHLVRTRKEKVPDYMRRLRRKAKRKAA